MSIARGRARGRVRSTEAGFTMVEVSISLALVVVMALIVELTLDSTQKAEKYLSAVRRATERGHKLSYEVRELVTASRRIFFNDEDGRNYLDALQVGELTPLAGARLPVVDALGRLGPDEQGEPRTGNILFFVGETDATAVVADPDGPSYRYIDTYRFVACYPCLADRRVVVRDEASPNAVDMVVWQSVEFPSYKQIMAISDPDERANVVMDLVDRFGVTMAWDPTETIENGFYDLDGQGNISANPVAQPKIEEDPEESDGGRLVYANVQLAETDSGHAKRKALFSVDDPNDWTPHGFEVKIAGPTGSRRVWMHLVVEVLADKGRVAVQPTTIIVSVKDM